MPIFDLRYIRWRVWKVQKAREIKYELLKSIQDEGWGAHRKLPGERELARKYGANVVTIRKTLNQMMAEGSIYRVERKGSFVSPEVRMGQVLVVTQDSWDYATNEFFRGIFTAVQNLSKSSLPTMVSSTDFLKSIHDLEIIFQNVAFVIFFRDPVALAKS
ncbi:MAG: GntR family transcriptional regulator, partial [Spirochaetia bacterium]|nr:GntR family transcriptional regulator [Spirochaetia bacterium]